MTPETVEPVELEQERSIMQLLRAALDVYGRYPWLFLILTVGVIVPYDLVVLGTSGSMPFGNRQHGVGIFRPSDAVNVLVIAPVIAALYAHAIIDVSKGRRPALSPVVLYGLRVLPLVIIAQIIGYVGIAIGAVFFIVPGIVLGLRWCVLALAIAVEHRGILGAFSRSGRLAAGHYWHILGLTLAVESVVLVAALGVHFITEGGSSGVVVALEVVVQTVMASYVALVLTMLYFDLCARQRMLSEDQENDLATVGQSSAAMGSC
jgi:hypothetical protein